MRRYVMEFVGTFFLVFTVCAAVLGAAPLAPLAIGAVLAAMIFAGGHISGAHYNPAVTLAIYLRGRLPVREIAPYVGAQLLAALAAAGIARFAVDVTPTQLNPSGRDVGAAFVVELLFTFALAFVILSVCTSKSHPVNSFYGLAIGFTVFAGAAAVGVISGGAFNPAVGLGIMLAGLVSWSMAWVYLVATLLGGAGAAYAFRWLNPTDR